MTTLVLLQEMAHVLGTLVAMVSAFRLTMSVMTIWTAEMPVMRPTVLQM